MSNETPKDEKIIPFRPREKSRNPVTSEPSPPKPSTDSLPIPLNPSIRKRDTLKEAGPLGRENLEKVQQVRGMRESNRANEEIRRAFYDHLFTNASLIRHDVLSVMKDGVEDYWILRGGRIPESVQRDAPHLYLVAKKIDQAIIDGKESIYYDELEAWFNRFFEMRKLEMDTVRIAHHLRITRVKS